MYVMRGRDVVEKQIPHRQRKAVRDDKGVSEGAKKREQADASPTEGLVMTNQQQQLLRMR
jgi:hypothetical protein